MKKLLTVALLLLACCSAIMCFGGCETADTHVLKVAGIAESQSITSYDAYKEAKPFKVNPDGSTENPESQTEGKYKAFVLGNISGLVITYEKADGTVENTFTGYDEAVRGGVIFSFDVHHLGEGKVLTISYKKASATVKYTLTNTTTVQNSNGNGQGGNENGNG